MSLLQSNSSIPSASIISLSSFDTISSLNNNQFTSYHNNTNNNKNFYNEKQSININSSDIKLDQTIDQAVKHFEQILTQCVSPSNTSLIRDIDQSERKDDIKSKLEAKKRHCEEFLHSLNQKQNFKIKQQKLNCRKWCEEQNQRIAKYSHSKTQHIYGSVFYCRKALLQKPDGITYICIRKRFD